MARKYYITNGDKYIGGRSALINEIKGTSAGVFRFKLSEAEKFLDTNFKNNPNWVIQKVFSSGSGKRYVITNATGYVSKSSSRVCTNKFEYAREFKSAADAEAFIRSHSELRQYFPDPIIVDDELNTYERSAHKEFTPEQLKTIGIINERKDKRIQFDAKLRQDVYERSGHHCELCGREIGVNEFTVDHIIPLARGGTNDMNNLRCLCHECNTMKGRLLDSEMNRTMTKLVAKNLTLYPYSDDVTMIIRSIVRARIKEYKKETS